ncbi:glycosyltransferase, partial [Streptomyces galilaeus]|uniref:glycosyltransferase n=1 Tax=Streptomyces galilaeus TaxID=33899 RepID=UPI0038F67E09
DRQGLAATAVLEGAAVRTRWSTDVEWPRVTVVIPTRHNRRMLSTCLPSLARTDYPGGFDVVVVDNGGDTADGISDGRARWYEE